VSRFIYRYAECHYAGFRYAECGYAEYRYAECRYAECHYAECRGAISTPVPYLQVRLELTRMQLHYKCGWDPNLSRKVKDYSLLR
jgi:hypothetical protein